MDENVVSVAALAPRLPTSVQRLRSMTDKADHVLDLTTYEQVGRLFDACITKPSLQAELRTIVPEHGDREFLLSVDQKGLPVFPSADLLADFDKRVAEHPDFGDWFQQDQIDNRPVLLAARWLCHLAGLRHRTIQLFLDHPTAEGYTLLQVRGLNKTETPGCFDMPCAGHVTGLQSVEDALLEELAQELGLDRCDISPPQSLGSYEYRGAINDPVLYNVEYRALHRSRLRPGALSRIRFVDHEVAGLTLFAVSEVQALLEAAPDRVASGLSASWSLYPHNLPSIPPGA